MHAVGSGVQTFAVHCAELQSLFVAHVSPSARSETHRPTSQRPETQPRELAHGSPRSAARTHLPLAPSHTARYAQRRLLSQASPSPTTLGATHVPAVHAAPARHGFVSLQG